jgi:hypothetical protein
VWLEGGRVGGKMGFLSPSTQISIGDNKFACFRRLRRPKSEPAVIIVKNSFIVLELKRRERPIV